MRVNVARIQLGRYQRVLRRGRDRCILLLVRYRIPLNALFPPSRWKNYTSNRNNAIEGERYRELAYVVAFDGFNIGFRLALRFRLVHFDLKAQIYI